MPRTPPDHQHALRRQGVSLIAGRLDEAAEGLYLLPKDVAARSVIRQGLADECEADGGRRASVAGDWQLDELEVLCAIMRHEASNQAGPPSEFVPVRKDET